LLACRWKNKTPGTQRPQRVGTFRTGDEVAKDMVMRHKAVERILSIRLAQLLTLFEIQWLVFEAEH
jgi:hypothetical protein